VLASASDPCCLLGNLACLNVDVNSIIAVQTALIPPDRRDPGNGPGKATGLGAKLCRDRSRSMAYALFHPLQQDAAIPCHSGGLTNAIEFPFVYLEQREE